MGKLSLEELRRYIDQGYRVRLKRIGGKTYVSVRRGKDGVERGAGPLESYDLRMQALLICLSHNITWGKCVEEAGLDDRGEHGGEGGSGARQPGRQVVSVRVGGSVVEREVELETIWNVRRIALDPRVYILYAYAQKYLGYTGSLGEFLSDCVILWFKERGIEVALRTMD